MQASFKDGPGCRHVTGENGTGVSSEFTGDLWGRSAAEVEAPGAVLLEEEAQHLGSGARFSPHWAKARGSVGMSLRGLVSPALMGQDGSSSHVWLTSLQRSIHFPTCHKTSL